MLATVSSCPDNFRFVVFLFFRFRDLLRQYVKDVYKIKLVIIKNILSINDAIFVRVIIVKHSNNQG